LAKGILFDSSILIAAAEMGRDLIALLEERGDLPQWRVTITNVVEEMERLAHKRSKKVSKMARLALQLAKKLTILPGLEGVPTDEAIVRVAREKGLAVATIDASLRRRLRGEGVPVIYLKDGYPEWEGAL